MPIDEFFLIALYKAFEFLVMGYLLYGGLHALHQSDHFRGKEGNIIVQL